MAYARRRFSVAETPTQLNFAPSLHQRARSNSQTSTLRNRLSFLSLTPSPKASGFTHLIEAEDKGYHPVYIFDQLCTPAAVTSNFIVPTTLSKAKSLFTFKLAMPSWSISSKSSNGSSKVNKPYRPYVPQPFFNAVAEYQMLNGGREESAVWAILQERGINNLSVKQAYEVFGSETVPQPRTIEVYPGVFRDANGRVWMDRDEMLEHEKLMSGSDDDGSSTDCESLYYASSFSSGGSKNATMGARRRPTPGQPWGFDDSFCPSPSNASFRSSVASSTLYAPSITSSTSSKSSKGGVRGMFKLGRK